MNDTLREMYLEDIVILESLMKKMNKSTERYAFCKREVSRRQMALSVSDLNTMKYYIDIPQERELRGCGDCVFSNYAYGGYSCDFNDDADKRHKHKSPCKYNYTSNEINVILTPHWNKSDE